MTGKYLKPNATVTLDNQGKPEVSIEWTSEGAKLFGEITQRDLNKPLGIFLEHLDIRTDRSGSNYGWESRY